MKVDAIVIFISCILSSIYGQFSNQDLLNIEEEGSGSIMSSLRDSVFDVIAKKTLKRLEKKALRKFINDFDTESSGDDDDDDAKLLYDELSGSGEEVKDEAEEFSSGEGSGYSTFAPETVEPSQKPTTKDIRTTLQKIWMNTLQKEAKKNKGKTVNKGNVIVINDEDAAVANEGKHGDRQVKSTTRPTDNVVNKNRNMKKIPYDEILNDVNGVPTTQDNTDTNEIGKSTQEDSSDKKDISNTGVSLTVFITIVVVIAAVFTILIIVFFVFRLRRRDEGSYTLDEPSSAMLTADTEYSPPKKEKEELYAC